jgi:hypothetical protein
MLCPAMLWRGRQAGWARLGLALLSCMHATAVHHLVLTPMPRPVLPAVLPHPTHNSLDTRARAYGDNLAENPRYAEKGKHYYDACGPTYKVAKVRRDAYAHSKGAHLLGEASS